MTSPVDPIRRTNPARRAKAAPTESAAQDFDERQLPTVVEAPAEPPHPPSGARTAAAAGFAAQLIGQDGQKRGLRGGPATLNAAKATYTRTEWSGAADRRARAGRTTKTEI